MEVFLACETSPCWGIFNHVFEILSFYSEVGESATFTRGECSPNQRQRPTPLAFVPYKACGTIHITEPVDLGGGSAKDVLRLEPICLGTIAAKAVGLPDHNNVTGCATNAHRFNPPIPPSASIPELLPHLEIRLCVSTRLAGTSQEPSVVNLQV